MTTLYRSPNVIMDAHEWHVTVRKHYGRVTLIYRWRPLSTRAYQWASISSWKGPKPKQFAVRMSSFCKHVREVLESEARRTDAIRAMRGPPTGAQCRNVGIAA